MESLVYLLHSDKFIARRQTVAADCSASFLLLHLPYPVIRTDGSDHLKLDLTTNWMNIVYLPL